MYSGTTFRIKSGRVMGVHQKIDRIAHRHLRHEIGKNRVFPRLHDILHFEGLNGPDGIKRKSPARDEPWHYIDPTNLDDRALIDIMEDHISNLTQALVTKDMTRAAFEAAWLAHAVTDGLTPAHHYPLEEKLIELRDGQALITRNSKKEKIILPGRTRRDQIRNNWEFWGAKGVMTTHFAFEHGVATASVGQRFDDAEPSHEDLVFIKDHAFEEYFRGALEHIDAMKMYQEFSRLGWNRHLAREVRTELMPIVIRTVMLAWYKALLQAEETKHP